MAKLWKFYGAGTDAPLSIVNNTPLWKASHLGQLYRKSNGGVFIYEIEGAALEADYVWRVVDARFSQEDSVMTRFHAHGLNGEYLGDAVFGVNPSDVQIAGGFKCPPRFGREYYIPREKQVVTGPGGQSVQVLDTENPSEAMAFALIGDGETGHQCLDIIFRLFSLGEGYPNDIKES